MQRYIYLNIIRVFLQQGAESERLCPENVRLLPPVPYRQRLWDKVPNPDYVTPAARGAMHSGGVAVDLTIVDAQGRELEMGTPYDFSYLKRNYALSDYLWPFD